METIVKQIEVSKTGDDLGTALSNVGIAYKNAVANGWQAGEDLPPILAAALSEGMRVIQVAPKVVPDFKENPALFVIGVLLGVAPAVVAFLAKPVIAPEVQA